MEIHWYMPVQLFGGSGCFSKHVARLQELGRRCLLLVGGASAQESGVLGEVLALLEQQHIEATVYSGIRPDPPVSQCREAAYAAQLCRAQFIVALGGGSVMDAAKATALLAANSLSDTETLFTGRLRRPALPLVTIGTTAGTGSEMTRVAVLTRDDTGRKQSFRNASCYPRYAFADPRYTATMPRSVTVSTALDALSHAVEGWFSPLADAMTRVWAEKAIEMLAPELASLAAAPAALPNEAGRERLLYASLWAGMALNITGAAFPHTMSYPLTEEHGVPHGMACAAFLPAFLRHAEQEAPADATALYAVCGGRERLLSLLVCLAPVTVSLTPAQIEAYTARWEPAPANFEHTPGGFTAAQAHEVLCRLTSTP